MALEPEAREKLRRLMARHRAEREELVEALQGAVDENEELRGAAAKAEKLEKEHGELKTKVKASTFRAAFDKAAKKAGVKEEMLEDAWELSKVDTSGDEPDEKAIGKGLGDFLEKRPHFKGESSNDDDGGRQEGQDGAQDKAAEQGAGKLEKGAGYSRGGASKGPAGKFVVNRSSLNDFDWMRANQERFNAESAAGNVHLVGNPS